MSRFNFNKPYVISLIILLTVITWMLSGVFKSDYTNTFEDSKATQEKEITVLSKQIIDSLEKDFDMNKIIIAYEPVWSIGTNKIPKMNELKNTIKFIKNDFKKILKTKKSPIVLYGGSVNAKNIRLFSSIFEIDGFLIGGASQSSKKFIDIIRNYYK